MRDDTVNISKMVTIDERNQLEMSTSFACGPKLVDEKSANLCSDCDWRSLHTNQFSYLKFTKCNKYICFKNVQ